MSNVGMKLSLGGQGTVTPPEAKQPEAKQSDSPPVPEPAPPPVEPDKE